MKLAENIDLTYITTEAGQSLYRLVIDGKALLAIAVDEDELTVRYGKPGASADSMIESSRLAMRKPASMEGGDLKLGRISMTSVAGIVADGGLLFRLAKVYGQEVTA